MPLPPPFRSLSTQLSWPFDLSAKLYNLSSWNSILTDVFRRICESLQANGFKHKMLRHLKFLFEIKSFILWTWYSVVEQPMNNVYQFLCVCLQTRRTGSYWWCGPLPGPFKCQSLEPSRKHDRTQVRAFRTGTASLLLCTTLCSQDGLNR